MKFLVTGAAGLVGNQVTKDLAALKNDVYSCGHKTVPEFGIKTNLDLTKGEEEVRRCVESTSPDVIIHLAAMTDIDGCDQDPEKAYLINSTGTKLLAKEAARNHAFFLYLSTDYVFDGKKSQGMQIDDKEQTLGVYTEGDKPDPLQVYGKSKLEGEKAIMDLASSWCIARTGVCFGLHKNKDTFLVRDAKKLTQATSKEQEGSDTGQQNEQENQGESDTSHKEQQSQDHTVTAEFDRYSCPVYVPNLSMMLIELCTRQITGLYHVGGINRVSRYYAKKRLAEKLSKKGNTDSLSSYVKGVNMADRISQGFWTAPRPQDTSLNVSWVSTTLNCQPADFDIGLDMLIEEMKEKKIIKT